VKNRFQNLPFKFNLQRYAVEAHAQRLLPDSQRAVGLCTLNQVDP
jgi:hypothetical protein